MVLEEARQKKAEIKEKKRQEQAEAAENNPIDFFCNGDFEFDEDDAIAFDHQFETVVPSMKGNPNPHFPWLPSQEPTPVEEDELPTVQNLVASATTQ